MRKEEFLTQLEYLLQDLPDTDREEAIDYYRDYLAEAGSEDEERVIEEFGSPERVAAIIRADVAGNVQEGGSFTEKGFEDERFRDPNFQVVKRMELPDDQEYQEYTGDTQSYQQYRDYEGAGSQSGYRTYTDESYREYDCNDYETGKKKDKNKDKNKNKDKENEGLWKRALKPILLIALLLLAIPIVIPVAGGAICAVGGVLAAVIGTAVCVLCLTAAAFIISVCLGAFGIAFLASTPLDSIFLFGIAVLGIGCGLLGAVCCYWTFGICIPWMIRICVKAFRWMINFGKEKVKA